MAYEQRDMSGVLFKNARKRSEKAPDFTGTLRVNGREYELAAWRKEGRDGKAPFLSIAVSVPYAERQASGQGRHERSAPRQDTGPRDDDDIPF